MEQSIIFVGNPGSKAPEMLKVIKTSGFSPKRAESPDDFFAGLSDMTPGAIMIADDVADAGGLVTKIREEPSLANIPVIAMVRQIDEVYLDKLFKSGIDDYHFLESQKQFASLIATMAKADSWNAVRAPAGQVIFADSDRLERIRFGHSLRRHGFDTYFAGDIEELEAAVPTVNSRVIIASARLPGGSVLDVIRETSAKEGAPPWIVIADAQEAEELGKQLPENSNVTFFESGADAEGITFYMNELLAPPPVGSRKSPRILYSVPVSFLPRGGEETFWGFTFNINLGGLFLRSLTSFPLQTPIDVVFRPPYGRGKVFVTAQVVWQKKFGDISGAAAPPGMGIQFVDMWQADKAAFDEGYRLLLEDSQDTSTSSRNTSFGDERK